MILDIFTKNGALQLLKIDSSGKTISTKFNDNTPLTVNINGKESTFQSIMGYYKFFHSDENKNNILNLKNPKDIILEFDNEYSSLDNLNILLVDFVTNNNQLDDILYFAPNQNKQFSFREILNKSNIKVTPQNLLNEYFNFIHKISKNIAAIVPKDINKYWETIYLTKLGKNPNNRNYRVSINKASAYVEHPNTLILDNFPLKYKKQKTFNEYGYLTLNTYEFYLEQVKKLIVINYMNKTLDKSTYSNKIWENTLSKLDISPINIGKYKPQNKGGFNHAIVGIYKNIQFFDFRSYYPSLFLSLNMENEFTKKLYPKMFELLSKRYELKDVLSNLKSHISELKEALNNLLDETNIESSINDLKNQLEIFEKQKEIANNEQLYYKLMINSFIGNLNNEDFKYYNPELYDAITGNGRDITQTIINKLTEKYGDKTVVYSDTDSMALNLDLINKTSAEIQNECNAIIQEYCKDNNLKSGFIELLPEDVYQTFLCSGAKNYLGVKDSGEFRISNMGINTSQNNQELINLLGQFIVDNIDKGKISEGVLYEKMFELIIKNPEIIFTKSKLNNKTSEEMLSAIENYNLNTSMKIDSGDYFYHYKDENNHIKIISIEDFINKKFPNLNDNYFSIYYSISPLVNKTLKVIEIANLGAYYKELSDNDYSLKSILNVDYIQPKKEDKKILTTNIKETTQTNIREDKHFTEEKSKFINLIKQKMDGFEELNISNNMSLVDSMKLLLSNVQPSTILGDGHPLRQDKNRSFGYVKKGDFYFGHDFADGKSYVLFELIPSIREDFNNLIAQYKDKLKAKPTEINEKKLKRSNIVTFLDIIKTLETAPQYLPKDIKNATITLLNKMNTYFETVDLEEFLDNTTEKYSKNDVVTNYIPIQDIPKNNVTSLHKDLFGYLQLKRKIYLLPNELPNIFYVCTQQISNFNPNFFFGLRNDLGGFDGRVFDNHSVASLSKTKIGENSPTSIISENCKKIIVVEGFIDMLSNIQEMGYKAQIGHISLNGVNNFEMLPYKELIKSGLAIQLSLDKDMAGIITTIKILNKLNIKLPDNLMAILDNQELFNVDNIKSYIDELNDVTKSFKLLSIKFTPTQKDSNEELVKFYNDGGIPFAKMKYELQKSGINLKNVHNFCDLMNIDGLNNKNTFNSIKAYILNHISINEKDENVLAQYKLLFDNVNNFLQLLQPEKMEKFKGFAESKGLDIDLTLFDEMIKKYIFTENTINQVKSGYLNYSLEDIYKDKDKDIEQQKDVAQSTPSR